MYVCTNSTIIIIISFHFIHTYTIFIRCRNVSSLRLRLWLSVRGVLNTFDVSYSHLLMKPKRYNMQTQSQSKTDDRPFEDKKKINTYSLVCSTIWKNQRKYKKKKKTTSRSEREREKDRLVVASGRSRSRDQVFSPHSQTCALVYREI